MEQLIEEVRTRPVIWDSTSESYRDATLKDKAWEEISEVLLKDKTSLKHQWKKLKDCHRQALLRRKTTTGQAAAKIKKWKYEDEMKFLLNTMMHRPSDSNIPLPNPNEEQGLNNGDQQEHLSDEQDDIDGDIESTADDVQTLEEMAATGKERRNRSPRGIDKVLTFMQDKEKAKKPRTKSVPDEIDLFFASAAQSVRKLPRRLRNKVKIDLLNSICRAEEENELNYEYNPATTPRPHTSFVPSPSTTTMYSQSSVSPSTTPSPLYNESSLSSTGYLINSLNENMWERL